MSDRWAFTVDLGVDESGSDHRRSYVPPDVRSVANSRVEYIVYEKELGDENHRPHWQGYVRFGSRKRMSTVKNLFACDWMHVEVARGTEEQNRTYCTKSGDSVFESGVFKADAGTRGARTDFEEIRDRFVSGDSLIEVAREFPGQFIRYANGLAQMQELLAPAHAVQRVVEVRVYWGPTGTGKTHRVMNQYPEAYQVEPGRDPWGRYTNQEVVCFDEFDYTKWSIQQMNRFLDKWRCPLDARYRDRYAAWTLVLILANSSPLSWWPNADMPLIDSFRRRVQGCVYQITARDQTLEDAHDHSCDNLVVMH